MKLKALLFAIAVFFISCTNDKKTTEILKQVSTLKSDILLESSTIQPFSGASENDFVYLSLSGQNILESTATFKAINEKGEELYCENFSAKELIQPAYKTANSTLQEAHIREVVISFFVDNIDLKN